MVNLSVKPGPTDASVIDYEVCSARMAMCWSQARELYFNDFEHHSY